MKKLIAILALLGSFAHAANVVSVSVKALDGFGGDTSSVLARCQTKEGSVYDEVTVSRDVSALKSTKEFQEIMADVRRLTEGVEVVFYVKRKMRFQAPIDVKGNSAVSESKIIKEADLKDGALYGEGDFAEAAARVRAYYQKKNYPDAKVSVVPKVTSGDYCELSILVDEGQKLKIVDYEFEGADHADLAELRAAIGDFPWWNPKGWMNDAPTSREQLAQSVAKVREYYRNRGYLDVKVSDPERVATLDGESVIRYKVEEGTLYKVGDISIQGLKTYPEGVVKEKSKLNELVGQIAGAKVLDEAAHRVAVVVGSGDKGLTDTHVTVRQLPCDDSEDKLDFVFVVEEGVPVVINEVRVEGNDYTKDKVIRREIELSPGNRMLADRAERSQRKLENLNYFKRVRYYLKETDLGKDETGAEYRDLVYEVEEQNTGNFMVGIGASSVDSVYVSAEVSQANFDLFAPGKMFRGAGQKARAYAQVGPRIQTYEISWSEPHFLDRYLELELSAYRRQRWYDDYDIIRTGGSVSLSYPVKFWSSWDPFGRLGFRFSGEFIEFDDIDNGTWEYKGREVSLREEDRKYGDAFEPVIRVFWAHDTRNSNRIVTKGSRTQLYVDYAPAGDNQYYKLGFTHRSYFTTWEKYQHVLMVAFRAETIDGLSDDVPIYNRLFLGGPKSIRGIEYRGVSPYARKLNRDGDRTNKYDPWGGQTLVCANIEYTIPVFKMLRLAAFSDIGSVSSDEFDLSDDFAWTAGIGVRLDIPMFPVRLDFATPIEKPDHADEEVFSFTVGYDF